MEPEPAAIARIEQRISRLAAVMNATGYFSAMRHDPRFIQAREAGIGVASDLLAYVLNERVHVSGNVVERLGFDPFDRIRARKRYAAAAVGVAEFGMRAAADYLMWRAERSAKEGSLVDAAAWEGFVNG